MAFKRLLQIGGPMLFTALSLALVEQIYFLPRQEIRYATTSLKTPPRASAYLPPSRPLSTAPIPAPAPSAPTLKLAEFPKPKRTRRREPARQIAAASEPVESTAPELPAPPPAQAEFKAEPRKSVWLWLSAAAAQHTLHHSLSNGTNSRFRSLGAPALGFRAGFEVEDFGLDAAYESAPGKVSSAPNAVIQAGDYHWTALRAEASWRGLGHDLKLRAGAQQHTSPLLYPDNSTARIYIRRARVNFAALGLEWRPQLSEQNRLEAKATYLHALSADTLDRAEIELSRRLSGTLSLGWVHSAGDHLRLATYWQSEIQSYDFTYRSTPAAAASVGSQKITSHSLGFRIGWEY